MINLVILSNKMYARDFRKYLIRAAAKTGSHVLHIQYNNHVVLTYNDQEHEVFERWTDEEICEKVKEKMGPGLCLVMMGYGSEKTSLVRMMKKKLSNMFTIYDVYDDFRYGAKGWARIKQAWSDWRCRKLSDLTVVLEDGLRRYYPKAFFLYNASHVPKLVLDPNADPKRVVYIGSLDERIDFDWLTALTAQDIILDIYGYVHVFTKEMEDQIETLLHKRPNVNYYGSYDNDDLPKILSKYRIGVVPYKTRTDSTRHINPDKIYHYLNAGLEVVAPPFPQVVRLAKFIHIMRDPSREWPEIFQAALTKPRNAKWPRNVCSWEKRWTDLKNSVFWHMRHNPQKISCDIKSLCAGETPTSGFELSHDEFLKKEGPKLLHLGCGTNLFEGWHNTDLSPVDGAAKLDFSEPFPFPDATLDAMFCEHTIEHIAKIDTYKMLCETFRALKPGAACRVVTPSLAKMAAMAVEPDSQTTQHYLKWFRDFTSNPTATVADAVNAMFYNHGHQHIFSVEELSDLLTEIGFTNLHVVETGTYFHDVFDGLDSHGKVIGEDITMIESFAIEAEKPLAKQKR